MHHWETFVAVYVCAKRPVSARNAGNMSRVCFTPAVDNLKAVPDHGLPKAEVVAYTYDVAQGLSFLPLS